jgi:hypothetical protein
MAAGIHASSVIHVLFILPNIDTNTTVPVTPDARIMASITLKNPNISVDFLVLAGIKNPPFTMYHTPFIPIIIFLHYLD